MSSSPIVLTLRIRAVCSRCKPLSVQTLLLLPSLEMEARKAADMLCRSYASLSLSNGISRTALSSSRVSSRPLIKPSICQSCRRISTQPSQSRPATGVARKPEPDYNDDSFRSRDTGFLPPRAPRSTPGQTSSAESDRPRTRILSKTTPSSRKEGSSVDDLIDAANESSRAPITWGAPQPSLGSRFRIDNMNFPSSSSTTNLPSLSKPRIVTELPIHVKPRTGRTIAVDPGKANDLGAKLRALEVLCNRNRIRQDFNRQKFHERPGLKRKRLHSERWRRNFRQRFNGVVGRVNDLRVQGW